MCVRNVAEYTKVFQENQLLFTRLVSQNIFSYILRIVFPFVHTEKEHA